MKKKSILEEALLEAEELENMIKSQSKDVLRSIMAEEINEFIKRTLTEEEDVEDFEAMGDEDAPKMKAPEMDDMAGDLEGEEPGEDIVPVSDDGDEDIEDTEIEDLGDEEEEEVGEPEGDDIEDLGDEEEIDLTGADMETVARVYKKLGPDDDIKVVQAGDTLEISDEATGSDYIVKLGGDLSESIERELAEMYEMNEMDMGDGMTEREWLDMGTEQGMGDMPSESYDMDLSEEALYEIELSEDGMCETCGGGHDEMGDDYMRRDEQTVEIPADYMGDDEYSELNLEGETLYELELAEVDEMEPEGDEEGLDEYGYTKAVEHNPYKRRESAYNFDESYDALKEKVTLLESKNGEYKKALVEFKDKLSKVAIFNTNLAHVTNLFTENTTTKDEKISILKRFDNVSTINESKKLYENIKIELNNIKPIKESVNERVNKTIKKSTTKNLNESVAFVNPQMKNQLNRMKNLMGL